MAKQLYSLTRLTDQSRTSALGLGYISDNISKILCRERERVERGTQSIYKLYGFSLISVVGNFLMDYTGVAWLQMQGKSYIVALPGRHCGPWVDHDYIKHPRKNEARPLAHYVPE